MLGFVFVPFAAIPLFLLVGSRKFPARAKGPSAKPRRWSAEETASAPKLARVLADSGVAPPRARHSFELVGDGEKAFARLVELIAGAQASIDLTMFILGHDETGRAIIDALAERASRGVSVRVILDAVGCPRSRFYAREKLEREGPAAEVRLFMPLRHSPVRGRTNLRSHRKLAVIDRTTIFGGGMNLAEEYMGPRAPKDGTRWRDVAAIVSGPVALDAEAMFESDWAFVGGKPRDATRAAIETSRDANEVVELVPSGPDFASDTVYDLFLTVIGEARSRIVIVTPYYVPDDALQHALVLAARRGVNVELVVPSISNHMMADVARRALLRELVHAGVVIHYYARGMVHAKAMITDDSFAYVGSPNFDMRSLYLNYENAICVYSPKAIADVRAFAEGLIAQSTAEGPKIRERATLEQLARFLAPEL
jgi:cardiolipin synthase